MKIEFLDILYKGKFKAESYLEELEGKKSFNFSKEDEELQKKLYETKLKNAEGLKNIP